MFNDYIIEDFYLRDVIVMKSLILEIPADAWSQKRRFRGFLFCGKLLLCCQVFLFSHLCKILLVTTLEIDQKVAVHFSISI